MRYITQEFKYTGSSKVLSLAVETNIERQSLPMFITKTDQLQSDQVSCYNIANFMCNKLIKALKKFTGVNVINWSQVPYSNKQVTKRT